MQLRPNYGLERTLSGNPHAKTERKHQMDGMPQGVASATLPHSPMPKMRNYGGDDQMPLGQLLMNSSGDNEDMMRRMDLLGGSTGQPSQVWAPPPHLAAYSGNKSAYNDDRGLRADAQSQLSQVQLRAQSIRTVTMPVRPPSPQAEKELLSKLDEVNLQVNNWLKDLEKKRDEHQTQTRVRAKSAITRPANEDQSH